MKVMDCLERLTSRNLQDSSNQNMRANRSEALKVTERFGA